VSSAFLKCMLAPAMANISARMSAAEAKNEVLQAQAEQQQAAIAEQQAQIESQQAQLSDLTHENELQNKPVQLGPCTAEAPAATTGRRIVERSRGVPRLQREWIASKLHLWRHPTG